MSKKINFPEVKQELKDRQAASQAIGARIRESKGLERWALWEEKREYGRDTRWLLMVYAFLRGIPFLVVERHSTFRVYDNWAASIHAKRLAELIEARGLECDNEKIVAWLNHG